MLLFLKKMKKGTPFKYCINVNNTLTSTIAKTVKFLLSIIKWQPGVIEAHRPPRCSLVPSVKSVDLGRGCIESQRELIFQNFFKFIYTRFHRSEGYFTTVTMEDCYAHLATRTICVGYFLFPAYVIE